MIPSLTTLGRLERYPDNQMFHKSTLQNHLVNP